MRRLTAKYPGRCRECGGKIYPGDDIAWAGRGRTYHEACWENPNGAAHPGELNEPDVCDECGRAHYGRTCHYCNAEYARGVQDVENWRWNRMIYGDEMAEAMEIEREIRDPSY